jgi:hypothetical protein
VGACSDCGGGSERDGRRQRGHPKPSGWETVDCEERCDACHEMRETPTDGVEEGAGGVVSGGSGGRREAEERHAAGERERGERGLAGARQRARTQAIDAERGEGACA